jgi:RNA polymerase sigma-70 factor (ECF subfamily)
MAGPLTELTSTSLLRAAAANDQTAWFRLVETYSRPIYRWCRKAGLQPEDSSNIAQEVLRTVARKLADFKHDHVGSTFRGWLRVITRNKIRDHFGRRSEQHEVARGGTDAYRLLCQVADGSPGGDTDDEPDFPPGIVAEAVGTIRGECSERDWEVFWQVVVNGRLAGDAGAALGMSANAVRLVKMRLLRRLRELLHDREPSVRSTLPLSH